MQFINDWKRCWSAQSQSTICALALQPQHLIWDNGQSGRKNLVSPKQFPASKRKSEGFYLKTRFYRPFKWHNWLTPKLPIANYEWEVLSAWDDLICSSFASKLYSWCCGSVKHWREFKSQSVTLSRRRKIYGYSLTTLARFRWKI